MGCSWIWRLILGIERPSVFFDGRVVERGLGRGALGVRLVRQQLCARDDMRAVRAQENDWRPPSVHRLLVLDDEADGGNRGESDLRQDFYESRDVLKRGKQPSSRLPDSHTSLSHFNASVYIQLNVHPLNIRSARHRRYRVCNTVCGCHALISLARRYARHPRIDCRDGRDDVCDCGDCALGPADWSAAAGVDSKLLLSSLPASSSSNITHVPLHSERADLPINRPLIRAISSTITPTH